MYRRSTRPLLVLGLALATVFTTGCEDEIEIDPRIPSNDQFLELTDAAALAFGAGINPNLRLAMTNNDKAILGRLERRLDLLVPAAVADALEIEASTAAAYERSMGMWTTSGTSTSDDTLDYEYRSSTAYYDSNGVAMESIVRTPTAEGELPTATASFTEHTRLHFRSGDLETGPAYEVRLDVDLNATVLVAGTAAQPEDVFDVTATVTLSQFAIAPDDTTDVDEMTLEFGGLLGPRVNRNGCVQNLAIADVELFSVEWDRWRAEPSIQSTGLMSFVWIDPEESIGYGEGLRNRPRFSRSVVVDCAP